MHADVHRRPGPVVRLSAVLAALAALGLAPAGEAESALSLPRPRHFGEIPAQTLDETGHRLGDAELRIEELPNGNVSFLSESHIDGGAANRLEAVLAPVDDGTHLRPLFEESRSDVSAGRGLGSLRIDHGERVIRCTSAAGEVAELRLPEADRVALAPMNLLFLPLVLGETREVDFQIAICRGGPRIVGARARIAPHTRSTGGSDRLVEVRYELDFGPLLSSLLKPFLPRLSLWFDPAGAGEWMAARMPLYSKGPVVVVVRSGVSPDRLGLDH